MKLKSLLSTAMLAGLVGSASGQLVINEIMQNPSAVGDSDGEYFEIYNPTAAAIDVEGWTIQDDGSNSHVINNGGPLEVPAGGYLVLGRNGDSLTNGGVTVDYEYSGFTLANGDDEVVLLDATLTEIDRVNYDGGPNFPDPTGASMELTDPAADNNVGSNWATATSTFGDGDSGTPGAVNSTLAGPDTTPPTIASTDPDGTSPVAVDANLTATFDEPVQAGSGFIQVIRVSDSFVVANLDVTSAPELSFSGNDLIIDLASDLDPSTEYTVLIPNGAVQDLAASPNGFAGNSAGDWSFTTAAPPIPEPTPVVYTPTGSGIDPTITSLSIEFDEPIFLNGTGDIVIKLLSDDSVVQTIDTSTLTDPNGASNTLDVTLNAALSPNTDYYVEIDAAIVSDGDFLDNLAVTGNSAWTFSTGAAPAPPAILFSQYYEGSSNNKYVELQNVSASPVTLDNYMIFRFNNADTENWKTGPQTTGSASGSLALDGITLQPGEYYLIANPSAVAPGYAAAGVNSFDSGPTFFSGDDSLVLYLDDNTDGTYETAEIEDALAFTDAGDEGLDTSFYRLNNNTGFDLTAGSTILDYENATTGNGPWQQIDTATVDATSTQTDPIALQFQDIAAPPSLDSFVVAKDAASTVVNTVTLDAVLSGGTADEYQVSEDPAFTGAVWQPFAVDLTYELSAGAGTKTVYFKVRNADGESAVLSDDITLNNFIYLGELLFTQYYENGGDKYVEITNVGGFAIDLTNYYIGRYTNADAENWKVAGAETTTLISIAGAGATPGTLAPGETFVAAAPFSTTPIDGSTIAAPNIADGNLNFNGNDSLVLYNDADLSGTVDSSELLDVLSFTNAGSEGEDASFVRIAQTQGFDFSFGTSILDESVEWASADLLTVQAASAGVDNEHLGTYPGGAAPSNDYSDWAAEFPALGMSGGFDIDFDNDGVPNGLEHVFGTDPTDASSVAGVTGLDSSGGNVVFEHRLTEDLADDVTVVYEWSVDLVNWNASGDTVGSTSVTFADVISDATPVGYDLIQVTATVSGSPVEIFVRANASAPVPN